MRTAIARLALVAISGQFLAAVPFPSTASAQLATPQFRANFTGISLPEILPPPALDLEMPAFVVTQARMAEDYAAMGAFRPSYTFWGHVFRLRDGMIAFGSAEDGRLLAVLPERGDWTRSAQWQEPGLAGALEGRQLNSGPTERGDQVASLLAPAAGEVVHNGTRGGFLLPNVERYGSFLRDWGAIYERFGAPAEIGLAQAMVESGLDGKIRSEADAFGFCQWLPQNWKAIARVAHAVIEGYNQTTQAAYCAAYLSILATKYGSYIPALSEHHAGGTNVVRVVVTGERLGGLDVREQYLTGSELVLDLREISPRLYSDIYGTYGPRSFRYSELVFGNAQNVRELQVSMPQEEIHAMRPSRNLPLSEITRRTGLSADEVRRFNPALARQVPAGANLYLPRYVPEFGPDVAFWRRPAPLPYLVVLDDFVSLRVSIEEWHDPSFRPVLEAFQHRFAATGTEEGQVMATMLRYSISETYTGPRGEILSEYVTSNRVRDLLDRGVRERASLFGDSQVMQ